MSLGKPPALAFDFTEIYYVFLHRIWGHKDKVCVECDQIANYTKPTCCGVSCKSAPFFVRIISKTGMSPLVMQWHHLVTDNDTTVPTLKPQRLTGTMKGCAAHTVQTMPVPKLSPTTNKS